MAFDAYIQIDGIKGESTDSNHKDWIEVLSYSPSTPQSAPAGAAAASRRVTHNDFMIVKHIDLASPKLYEMASTGKHISKVTVDVVRAAGGSKVKYMTVEMNQVIVSNVSSAARSTNIRQIQTSLPIQPGMTAMAATPALLTESVSLNYGSIKWVYSQQ